MHAVMVPHAELQEAIALKKDAERALKRLTDQAITSRLADEAVAAFFLKMLHL